MRSTRPWLFALAVASVASASASAQDLRFSSPQVYQDRGARYVLRPAEDVVSMEGLDALGRPQERVVERVLTRDPSGGLLPEREGAVRGGVGNAAVAGTGANVGFTYLMPMFKYDDFQRTVPAAYQGLFPTFGRGGPADALYAFSPRVDLNYDLKNLGLDTDLSVSTAGSFLNLTGRVDRQSVQAGGATAQLNAQSSLTLVTAIPVEFGSKKGIEGGFGHCPDSVFDLRLGSRFVSFDQNYTGVTVDGGATSNRYAAQTFRGLGVTAASIWYPRGELGEEGKAPHVSPFLSLRQSLTLGENRRNTASSVTAPGVNFADSRFDTRTLLLPSTEAEFGLEWNWRGATQTRDVARLPVVKVRVAAVGQYWYGMGPLSTAGDFRRNDLFLVGGYIQAGLGF